MSVLLIALPASRGVAAPNIPDPARLGSLTISKHYLPRDDALDTNGMQQPINTGKNPPIPGVEFTIFRVDSYWGPDGPRDLSLLTIESWQQAGRLTVSEALSAQATVTPVPGGVATTDGNGQVVFAGLPIGLYLVRETRTPAGFDHDNDPATPVRSLLPSAPFLVTIPFTNPVDIGGAPVGTTWLYDVFAYPKSAGIYLNKETNLAKLPHGAKVGEAITYTLTGAIPDRSADVYGKPEIFKQYRIVDRLDPRLELRANSVRVSITNTPFIDLEAGDYTVSVNGDTIAVEFTASGLRKLDGAYASRHRVQVTFAAAAREMGEIPNGGPENAESDTIATLTVQTGQDANHGDPELPPNPAITVSSPQVLVNFGGEALWKVSSKAPTVGLPTATFRLFRTKEDALAYAADPDGNSNRVVSFFTPSDSQNLATIDYKATPAYSITTDAAGYAIIAGLAYGDYWVLETEAPFIGDVQYTLLPEPFKITIDSQLAGWPDAVATADRTTVVNVPNNAGFMLPMTGSNGTHLIVVLGILTLGVSASLLLESRRRGRSA